MSIWDAVGLLGVALVLGAYLGLQAQRMKADGRDYLLLNLTGSGLILVSLTVDFNLSAAIIEIAWILISIYGLVRSRRIAAARLR